MIVKRQGKKATLERRKVGCAKGIARGKSSTSFRTSQSPCKEKGIMKLITDG
jgi:hypothetical protein